MNSLLRLTGYSALLLLVFLTLALAARGWLQQQSQQLRAEAIAAKQQQFLTAVALTHRAGQTWDAAYLDRLGRVVGATVKLPPNGGLGPEKDPGTFFFDEEITEAAGSSTLVRVTFAGPATVRLAALQQRVVIGLGLLAAALFCGYFALLLILPRPGADRDLPAPAATAKAEFSGLTQLARTSAAQSEELDRERGGRRRAEEDAQFRQSQLAQALEEKIRLGHDLHDGIIQSLYAVGLTLESARGLLPTDPAAADAQLEKCRQSLNDTIRSVREYITGLTPENLRLLGFAKALDTVIAGLHAGPGVKFQVRVDDEAAALLTAEQSGDALQIARESISNSLRHSHANSITVRLHQADREIGLLIQDNGVGFDPARPGAGHGLRNLHARVARLGGTARVESQTGIGTRVIVTLPIRPPA